MAQIDGFEDSDRIHVLALELVERPPLADRVARAALPVEKALAVARRESAEVRRLRVPKVAISGNAWP